jgi:hypothetical protein
MPARRWGGAYWFLFVGWRQRTSMGLFFTLIVALMRRAAARRRSAGRWGSGCCRQLSPCHPVILSPCHRIRAFLQRIARIQSGAPPTTHHPPPTTHHPPPTTRPWYATGRGESTGARMLSWRSWMRAGRQVGLGEALGSVLSLLLPDDMR